MKLNENTESQVQPEQSDVLLKESVSRNAQSSVVEEEISENNALEERAEWEHMGKDYSEKIMISEITSDVTEKVELPLYASPIPRPLDVQDDCLVSAIRVESRISDEEESEALLDKNTGPTGAFRTPLQSVGSVTGNNRNEGNYEEDDDDDEEDWDDEEDEELLEVEKSKIGRAHV